MQSFVVQNFQKHYPFFEKSKRSVLVSLLKYNQLLIANLKPLVGNNNFHVKYFNSFLIFSFFLQKLKNIFKNNLILSLKYFLLKTTTYNLTYVCRKVNYKPCTSRLFAPIYILPQTYSTLFFRKSVLNHQILQILNYLLMLNLTPSNFFYVHTTTLVLPLNFSFLNFLNLFYFKLRNY
jgi:hypothetical protein